MNTPNDDTQPRTGRDRAIRWLENQGVSTVLLLIVLYGIYALVPKTVEQMQQGYKDNADQLEKSFTTHTSSIDRLLEYIQRREQRRENDRAVIGS